MTDLTARFSTASHPSPAAVADAAADVSRHLPAHSMRLFPRRLVALAILPICCTLAHSQEHEHGTLTISPGMFALLENDPFFALELEYRFPRDGYRLRPILGLSVIRGGGYYGYVGLRYEIPFKEHWTLAPSFSAGWFDDNHK